MASIRAHRDSNTLIIMKNSSYTRPIVHRINLILGINARCMEQVVIDGNLELGKNAQVTGTVKAKDAILGPNSIIYGDLAVNGDLVALDNAKVIGHVWVAGAVFVRPGVRFGSLDAGGLIEIQGAPPSKHIKGKMVINDGLDYPEAGHRSGSEALRSPEPEEKHAIKPPRTSARAPEKGQASKGKQPPSKKKMRQDDGTAEEKPKHRGFFGLFR